MGRIRRRRRSRVPGSSITPTFVVVGVGVEEHAAAAAATIGTAGSLGKGGWFGR